MFNMALPALAQFFMRAFGAIKGFATTPPENLKVLTDFGRGTGFMFEPAKILSDLLKSQNNTLKTLGIIANVSVKSLTTWEISKRILQSLDAKTGRHETLLSSVLEIFNKTFNMIWLPLATFLGAFLYPIARILLPLVRMILAIVMPLALSFFRNWNEIVPSWTELVGMVSKLVEFFTGGAGEVAGSVVEGATNLASNIAGGVGNLASNIAEGAGNFAEDAKNAVQENLIDKIVNGLKDTGAWIDENLVKPLSGWVDQYLVQPFLKFLENPQKYIETLLINPMTAWFATYLIEPLINFFASFVKNIPTIDQIITWFSTFVIQPLVKMFNSFMKNIPTLDQIIAWFNTFIIQPFVKMFDSFVKNIPTPTDIMNKIIQFISSPIDALLNAIKSAIDTAKNQVLSFLSSPIKSVGSFVTTITGSSAKTTKRMQFGGLITEPIFGFGLHSGSRYLMGESGPERVVPLTGTSHGYGYGNIVVNITVQGSVYANDLKRIVEEAIIESGKRRLRL